MGVTMVSLIKQSLSFSEHAILCALINNDEAQVKSLVDCVEVFLELASTQVEVSFLSRNTHPTLNLHHTQLFSLSMDAKNIYLILHGISHWVRFKLNWCPLKPINALASIIP